MTFLTFLTFHNSTFNGTILSEIGKIYACILRHIYLHMRQLLAQPMLLSHLMDKSNL